MLSLFPYMKTTYLDNNRALFNGDVWFNYDKYGAKTNLAAEGFNYKLFRILNKAH